MSLAGFYFADPRLVLVPIEHLTPTGTSRAFAALVRTCRRWSAERIALLDAGFARYWERGESLARRTRTWPAPRLRHVAVVADPATVRPYVQLLNTSAWMLYDCDLDPDRSDPELVAYLLTLGDRMALSGAVATAPLHAAAYWFERTPAEVAAFATAAARSSRPDAAALRAVAAALEWMRTLRHETLRPPTSSVPQQAISGTGLLVPAAIVAAPPALVHACAAAARTALATFHDAWRRPDRVAVAALTEWLADAAPRLLVTTVGGRIVWDCDAPTRTAALRSELHEADGVAVAAIHDDLRLIDERSRAVRAALVAPRALPAADPDTAQSGYAYLHRTRSLIAYNLHEPGMERLRGPTLPYARAMLAARTMHEWAHLVDAAGWVPLVVTEADHRARVDAFAAAADAAVAAASTSIRALTAADVAELTASDGSVGRALARIVVERMPDYRANLVARRVLSPVELETYVRHNVRALRHEYPPARLWRMLARYLYEYQYLRFSGVDHARTYFLRSTWFDRDYLESGALDATRFDELAARVAALCDCWEIDPSRLIAGRR
ncbi:MAG: hypothetical protein E6J72_12540 [Deltaproteobacteria bacterium]|nr:MAG: hypothetical protein E6J72_12540 [Deltaproteobacteria bacterium]